MKNGSIIVEFSLFLCLLRNLFPTKIYLNRLTWFLKPFHETYILGMTILHHVQILDLGLWLGLQPHEIQEDKHLVSSSFAASW